MKTIFWAGIFLTSLVTTRFVQAATLYVDAANPNPIAPYADWAAAATNIQDAIDLAVPGDVVLVTNGVYATGGKVMFGDLTNRVALDKAITVQSVNGPWVTTIRGNGATNGPVAVRCAWLANGATLQGFTLTEGATRSSGDLFALESGGGAWCASTNALVANCIIRSNTSIGYGSGFYQGTVQGSYVIANQASQFSRGAVADANVVNCTVVSNIAVGVSQSGLNLLRVTNSIVYYNSGGNYSGGTFAYVCSSPLAPGTGNISNSPLLQLDGIHLASASPCRGSGTNVVGGVDLFGKPWGNPPSIGCAEWVTAPRFEMQPSLELTSFPGGFSVGFVPDGEAPLSFNWYRDGALLSDDGHYSGVQTTNLVVRKLLPADAGNYYVVASNAFGVATSTVTPLVIHFVSALANNSIAPYTNWNSAAATIQDAIDAAQPREFVLVTNGIYNSGGKVMFGDLTNRAAIDKAVTVMSVNGFHSAVIEGAWDSVTTNGPAAIRGVWLGDGAKLIGFTVRNGATRSSGEISGGGITGGSTNALVINCLLTNNSASFSGGGAYNLILRNCTLVGNSAVSSSGGGGGAANCSLYNCTVVNNLCFGSGTPYRGGGTRNSFIRNSIVVNNFRQDFSPIPATDDHYESSSGLGGIWYSCCSTLITAGQGNILTSPNLLDAAYHIPAVSPCRGTGNSAYASGEDMDGEVWANPPSMGADEVIEANLVGDITFSVIAPLTNTLVGSTRFLNFWDSIIGRVSRIDWNFGDGVIQTNVSYFAGHAWTNPGTYAVTSTAYNSDFPGGVSRSVDIQVVPVVAPGLESVSVDGSGFRFAFEAQQSARYTIQYATNLNPPVAWQTLQSIFFSPGGTTLITDPAKTNSARFYRVLAQ